MSKWGWRFLVGVMGLMVAIGAGYVTGIGKEWVEQVMVERYQLSTKGWGANIPDKDKATMIVSADGGSALEPLGLKYAFVDGVYFEGVWRWGMTHSNDWLVFQYRDGGQDRWLIAPVRGSVGWTEGSGKTQSVSVAELEQKLKLGEKVSLSWLYRFRDTVPAETIRAELVAKRASYQQKEQVVVEWELGAFPGRIFPDSYMQNLLTEEMVLLLNDSDIRLESVGIL